MIRRAASLRFFTASRAHHAEIGGIAPGSMPPLSKNLAEEGVLIRNLKIVEAGESRFDDLRTQLLSGRYPTRDVETNLADVAAQVAANRQGANDLAAMVERYSWPVVRQYMDFVQDAAERKVRQALGRFPAGTHSFTDYLETADGRSTPICVRFTIHEPGSERAATIDFTGTGPVVAGNLNANRAIVTAAVIYVLRVLVDEDIPLNHGVLRPVEIVLPTCLLNPAAGESPETTPAVAGGNVETSQRVVDVLLGALGVAAASQGTMNNVVLGDATFGYYETICGGSGATAEAAGRECGAGSHDQHAADRPGDSRAALSDASARVFDSPRVGRSRAASRRRWSRATVGVLAAADAFAAHAAPRTASAVWNGGRRGGCAGCESAYPSGWFGDTARRNRSTRSGRGRYTGRGNAGRRRIWKANSRTIWPVTSGQDGRAI